MTFRVEAPYPASASTMILPSPDVGNNTGLLGSVIVLRMEDGSRRSYIKKADGKKRHRWTFLLSRDKMEEFTDFFERYRGDKFRILWRDEIVICRLGVNPVEVRASGGNSYTTTVEMVE